MNRINTPGTISLDTDEAEDLADTLSFVEDWLRHASDEAIEDLAEYIDRESFPTASRAVVDVFVIQLGLHVVALRQRIKQVSR